MYKNENSFYGKKNTTKAKGKFWFWKIIFVNQKNQRLKLCNIDLKELF